MADDIKVYGPGGVRGTAAAKGARRTTTAGGPSFAEMLEQAGDVSAPEPAPATLPNLAYAPLPEDPATSKRKSKNLMQSLSTLADDALGGQNPMRALADLQAALQEVPTDGNELTTQQKQALDELATRAAVEVAKRS